LLELLREAGNAIDGPFALGLHRNDCPLVVTFGLGQPSVDLREPVLKVVERLFIVTTNRRAPGEVVRRAKARATELAPAIAEIRQGDLTSLREIAAALDERGIPTARGRGNWWAAQVARTLAKL
jgi:hypothetical protein